MADEAKAVVNARNAMRSTGPRSPAGKVRSAANALRHGLTAQTLMVIPGEAAGELQALADRMRATLAPEGELEERLVERVVGLMWRLRRVGRVEGEVLRSRGAEAWGWRAERSVELMVTIARYETSLDRALYAALHELQRLQAARAGEPVRAPAALDVTVTAGEEAA